MRRRTVFITGGSRGIGKAIGIRMAREGCNVVIAAKTTEPHPKLEGTIYSAAAEIEAAGGACLPVVCDIREESQIVEAINSAAERFGGIDVLVNNASAINLSPASVLPAKQWDLMHDINVRGTYLVSRHAIPHLKQSDGAHILVLSPPISMNPQWFAHFSPYTISKFGMSMLVTGLSHELKKDNIAVNALWPATTIATAAVRNLLGGEEMVNKSRTPDIVADAAAKIFSVTNNSITGQHLIDEDVLRSHGVNDFTGYAVDPTQELMKDLFLE